MIRVAGILLAAFLTVTYTATLVVSHFSQYDDEGFMLFALRQFQSGVPLYDGMYTEYGPFYFLSLTGLLSLAGLPLTHDVIRSLTIAALTVLATGWALCAWFWGRSLLWTLAVLLTAAINFSPLRGEPGHPQLLIQLFVLAAFGAFTFQNRLTRRWTFFLVGGILAAVSLMKINVGIFLLLGLASLSAVPSSSSRILGLLRPAVILLAVSMPTFLLYRHLSQPSALVYWAVFTFGIAALLYSLRRSNYEAGTAPLWAAAGYLVVFIGTVTATVLAGTSPAGVLKGVLLQPMEYSRAIPFQKTPSVLLLIGTLACIWSAFVLLKSGADTSITDRLRLPIALGLAVISAVSPVMPVWLAPAMLWFLLPGRIDSDQKATASFVISTASFCLLIPYPVNGSQVNLSGSLVFLAAIAGVMLWRPPGSAAKWPRIPMEFALCALTICLAVVHGIMDVALYRQTVRVASGLPHSRLIRLPPEYAATFNEINNHVASKCDALVTLPGMNSFHVWSNVPRVTPYTVSTTMVLFDAEAQEALRRAFVEVEHPCVIYHAGLEEWSDRFRIYHPEQPFRRFVKTELVPVYSRSGYEIRVPGANAPEWLP